MTTAFITHRSCWLHHMGDHHPECSERLDAIQDQLMASRLDPYLLHLDAPPAEDAQLERVHDKNYIEYLKWASPKEGFFMLDPDTAMSPHTLEAAYHAAGSGVLAVDAVLSGQVENAFCSVRPPGHHAERAKAMGFCFFNNIAVAMAHAISAHGLSRVAIVDFDVHHGNGTEDIFADNEKVLMVGAFQHPFYPYSGTENTAANMLNVPLPAGTRGEQFRAMVQALWLPRLCEFEPQALFISAGFDAHYEDDMASLALLEADYAWVTEQVMNVTKESTQGRVVSMLEGGYDLSSMSRSAVAHIKALSGL